MGIVGKRVQLKFFVLVLADVRVLRVCRDAMYIFCAIQTYGAHEVYFLPAVYTNFSPTYTERMHGSDDSF